MRQRFWFDFSSTLIIQFQKITEKSNFLLFEEERINETRET